MSTLKKTSVYLSDNEISLLKKKAALQNKTVAEVIRLSIQQSCKPTSKAEEKAWRALDKIWSFQRVQDSAQVEKVVDEAVQELRSAKRPRRRA